MRTFHDPARRELAGGIYPDSYLAMLAKHHGIKLATLEEPLAKRFPEVSEWVK